MRKLWVAVFAVVLTAPLHAQRVVTVKMTAQATFSPSHIEVGKGDTVRFLQTSELPHNVHFVKEPNGAKLSKTSGPYLTKPDAAYDVVIDNRFVPGTYEFICDPHEMLGMKGTLVVK